MLYPQSGFGLPYLLMTLAKQPTLGSISDNCYINSFFIVEMRIALEISDIASASYKLSFGKC